jgi:tRNA(adenine34) deaminase
MATEIGDEAVPRKPPARHGTVTPTTVSLTLLGESATMVEANMRDDVANIARNGGIMTTDHEYFMRIALEEAKKAGAEGNSAVGSIVVCNGEIIGLGRNLIYTTHDVTAHAEVVALRHAGEKLGTIDFLGCTLYSTFEPCPMCCGAILLSRVSELVVGGRKKPEERTWKDYQVEDLIDSLGRSSQITVVHGVLVDECVEVRSGTP